MGSYDKDFFDHHQAGSFTSAEVIVPLLEDLVQFQSAIDVGCGVGTWLRALMASGISDTLGVDGDYVDRHSLQVPKERFRPVDLSRPFTVGRTFDLAVSLEVAEHLPAESAEGFIDSLVRLAPVVVFSAAVPFQGGTHHVNKQWPEYWAKIFDRYGYAPLDCIRLRIWNDPRVEWWYAQNILIYANDHGLSANPKLAMYRERTPSIPLPLVHPRKYLSMADPEPRAPSLRDSLLVTMGAAKSAFLRRLGRR